jgi:alpha-glucosidase
VSDPGTGEQPEWWRHAVCYQVYVRSFADSDGDGLGDLPGITSRLPYLRDLGVDALWITPFYPSPQHDAGYDVADYVDVDPRFGKLADIDALIARAHELQLKLIVDLVPNHTSWDHAWFKDAKLARAGTKAGDRKRERYMYRPGRGKNGERPPNNWESVFGGPSWTRADDGSWYLHLFDTSQPDLNWRNPEVPAMFEDVLRFWLDRGVDGFRVDVAHGLFKVQNLRNQRQAGATGLKTSQAGSVIRHHGVDEPMWDQPEVHGIYRAWHRVLASYAGDRMAVAEAWTQTPERMAAYVRPDELHQAFNFAWLLAPWSAAAFAEVITGTLSAVEPVGAAPTWVLSNHDVIRHATRYGGGQVGVARARAATLAMLALPGSSYIYQGEELGLEEVDVPPAFRQDPLWFRTGQVGRDGCRVPIPWRGSKPPYGFGSGGAQPWLPQPESWKTLTVAAQRKDPGSTWSFYRDALRARRRFATTAGDTVEIVGDRKTVLEFRRGPLHVVTNCGSRPVRLPKGEVVMASGPLAGPASARMLPPDTGVWLT